ncbi:MAG: B12-binding domain-containing radical SAM protein [Elusimicrobia bacterium]|nr:B12-binding domain-containing radical SAM protein [Elusimicrobiota bacterium]
MTKILFLQNYWHEQLGVMRISALLKKHGHECGLLISDGRSLLRLVKKSRFDLIAFSCTSGQHYWALKTAMQIKKTLPSGISIILGGPHPTFFPEVIEHPAVDIICRGEGEYPMLELADDIGSGRDISRIENLWVKKDGQIYKNRLRPAIEDIDDLPFPDRSIYYKYSYFRDNHVKNFMAARGCPYNCSYCGNYGLRKLYGGSYYRHRSVDNVVREIKKVKDSCRLKVIRFQDDILAVDKEWTRSFCSEYKKVIDLPFICHIMANTVDEDIIKQLKGAGCIVACFGIESGDENYRLDVLNKPLKDIHIVKTAGMLRRHGMFYYTQNMFGMPGETLANALKTVNINRRIRASVVGSIFQPLPGTKLAEECIKKKLIKHDDIDRIGSSYQKSVLKQKDTGKLVNLCHLFYFINMVRAPSPLVRLLISFPPNFVYLLIYRMCDALSFFHRTRMGLPRLFIEIIYQRNYHLDRPIK